MDVPKEILEGMALSSDRAHELETRLDAAGGDAADRTRLIGYYVMASLASPEAAFHSARHIITLAVDFPEAEVLGTPFGTPANEAACAELSKLWRRHIEANPRNARILENAARFFSQVDRPYAQHLRYRLQLIDPDRYRDFEIDFPAPDEEGANVRRRCLADLEAQLARTTDPEERFHLMVRFAPQALREGKPECARDAAQRVLQMAPRFPGDWDLGNALHDANQVLGILALEDGDADVAAAHLLASAEAPGSPQLASFGPEMGLAKRLLEEGERDAVLQYLRRCRAFWEMGSALLDTWEEDVRAGRTPNFLGNVRL